MSFLNSRKKLKTYLLYSLLGLSLVCNSIYAQSVKPYPTFPGGEEAMMKFLRDNIRYPKIAIDKKEEGLVRVTFIVEYDGKVSSVLVWEGLSIPINEEAARVVKSMPRWNLGYKNGKRVRGQYSVWLDFKIPDNFMANKKAILTK